MPVDTLWAAYSQGDSEAREALLLQHLNLVHHVARQLSRSLASHTDFDELVSCGTIGLINALDDFEPSRRLAFSTFAVPRIRGAILDELRRQDHVPRSVRRKSRELAHAHESLTHALGRQPTQQEMASELGLELETLWEWRADHEWILQVSLDDAMNGADVGGGECGTQTLESITPDRGDLADVLLDREQEAACLQRALGQLKEQERTVLTLYYFEELKLHEIAAVLGVTESRASQVRTKALGRLRQTLSTLRAVA